MKLGILGTARPFRGGIAQFLHNMADELAKEHEVVVFNFIKQYPKLFFPGKGQTDESVKTPLPPFKKEGIYPIYQILTPYNPCTWKAAAKFIISQDIEHLIIKFWIPFFSPAYRYITNYLKKHSKVQVHILCHNIEFHEWWFLGDCLTRSMLKNSDSIIVLSENVNKIAKQFYRKKIIKLFHPPYSVETISFEQSTSFEYLKIPHKPTVLFFGYIKPYKGLDVLLKAIPIVNKTLPDVQFLVAGEIYGRSMGKIRATYGQLPSFKDTLIIHDKFIPESEIVHYFNVADVVVLPYKTATQSGVIHKAYSYNKPVISSDLDGLREMIVENETGLLFKSEDHEDFAEKIVYFYREFIHKDYAEKIAEFNQNHSLEMFVKRLVVTLSN